MSTRNNKQNAPAGDGHRQGLKRRKDKLIRLDDLIPKGNVVGGGQLLFGATYTTQTTTKPKQQDN